MQLAKANVIPVVGLNYKDKPEDGRSWLAQNGNPYRASVVDRDHEIRNLTTGRFPRCDPAEIREVERIVEREEIEITAISPGLFKLTQDAATFEREIKISVPVPPGALLVQTEVIRIPDTDPVCPGKSVRAAVIYYKSVVGYRGPDTFSYEQVPDSGKTFDIDINIK